MCYSTWHLGEWHEVKESAFELLPPHPNPKYGVSMPRIRVTMYEGGIICVFSRKVALYSFASPLLPALMRTR